MKKSESKKIKFTHQWGIWLVCTRASKIKPDWCKFSGVPLTFPVKSRAQLMADAWIQKDFIKKATVKQIKVGRI